MLFLLSIEHVDEMTDEVRLLIRTDTSESELTLDRATVQNYGRFLVSVLSDSLTLDHFQATVSRHVLMHEMSTCSDVPPKPVEYFECARESYRDWIH